jgi:hypothetical protein
LLDGWPGGEGCLFRSGSPLGDGVGDGGVTRVDTGWYKLAQRLRIRIPEGTQGCYPENSCSENRLANAGPRASSSCLK